MTDFFEPAGRGVQHANLRAANRKAVLTTITVNPGISNADVSRRTGLAPQTASAIVAELEAEGLIARGEVLRGRRGQPATPLSLNYQAGFAIGVEIGWGHIEAVLINFGSRTLARHRRDYAFPDATTIVGEAVAIIAEMFAGLGPDEQRHVVGVGLATPTDIERNIHHLGAPAEQVAAWAALDLRAAIEAGSGLSTIWFNDGNAGCWSEMIMRPTPRPSSFGYLFVGTFLGSGIIAEHTLRDGPSASSAWLGSMQVLTADGRRQPGHLVASLTSLRRRLAAAGITVPVANPIDWPWADWEPHVELWLAEAAGALADIILNTRAVLELDLMVLDGQLPPPLLERLLAATDSAIDAMPPMTFERPHLVAGRLSHRAASLGAAQLPLFLKLFASDLTEILG